MGTYKKLMEIKKSIQNENISYSEIVYLQAHKPFQYQSIHLKSINFLNIL